MLKCFNILKKAIDSIILLGTDMWDNNLSTKSPCLNISKITANKTTRKCYYLSCNILLRYEENVY